MTDSSTQRYEANLVDQNLVFSKPLVPIKRYKSICQLIIMSLFLCISALIFGYSLTQIQTIPVQDLQQSFDIQMNILQAQGLLTGTMPIGGIFGGFASTIFLGFFSRRNAHFVLAIITILGTILTEIPFLPSLFAGRFIIGIACGIYTAIAPVYIKQISPKEKKSQLGALFIVFKVSGVLLSYILGLFLHWLNVENYWRYIFMMPGLLALLQVLGILFCIPPSPVEMIQKENIQMARQVVMKIYEATYVDEVLNEMILDYKAQIAKTQKMEQLNQVIAKTQSFRKNRRRALIMAIHIAIMRQFIGVNCLGTYSHDIVRPYSSTASTYTPLVINFVQLLGTIFAITWVVRVFPRRPIFQAGVGIQTLLCLGIGISLIFDQLMPALVFMVLYMFCNGSTLGAVSWAYPAQIVPPSKQPIVTFFSWVAISMITIFPPMIISVMPNGNAYPLFFFFATWGLGSFVYGWFCLVQSKGRSYEQIIAEF